MPLQSIPLLVVAVLAAVGIPVAIVLLWPRLGRTGPATLAARVGLLIFAQLAALVATGVIVNRVYDFYSSWSDLLGTTGVRDVAPATMHTWSQGPTGRPGGGAPPLPADPRGVPVGAGGHGRVVPVTFRDGTGLVAAAAVYLPAQYFDPRYRHDLFPAAEVLTGYPGHLPSLLHRMNWPGVAAAEVAAGRARPMVLVMLSPNLVMPRDTECANVPGGPQVDTFLSRVVPAQTEARFRVTHAAGGWGITGYSTGGFCATKLAMEHPDVFRAAASMSGYYTATLDRTTGALYGGSTRLRDLNDPTWRLRHLTAPPISLLVTVSKAEQEYPGTLRFLRLARPPMTVTSIIQSGGGHNFGTWTRVEPTVLDWLSQHLAAPAPPTAPAFLPGGKVAGGLTPSTPAPGRRT